MRFICISLSQSEFTEDFVTSLVLEREMILKYESKEI